MSMTQRRVDKARTKRQARILGTLAAICSVVERENPGVEVSVTTEPGRSAIRFTLTRDAQESSFLLNESDCVDGESFTLAFSNRLAIALNTLDA